MDKAFLYTIVNLKCFNQLIGEYRKLDWTTAIDLCANLNQAAKQNKETPNGWECLYVIIGDD